MSNELNALLARVEKLIDDTTARDLRRHVEGLKSRREFGLNFERHIPESVDLIGRQISVGDKVRFVPPRGDTTVESDATWLVTQIDGPRTKRVAALLDPHTKNEASRSLDDLVFVADFRDPIYPGMRQSCEPVLEGGDKPFHTVINGENYHALEALLFAHEAESTASTSTRPTTLARTTGSTTTTMSIRVTTTPTASGSRSWSVGSKSRGNCSNPATPF